MGIILAKLRSKPSTKELLEDLEKEIEALEEYKRSTEQQLKKVVGSLIFYFILLFILASGIFIIYYYPALHTTKEKVLYSLPLITVPIVFYLVKRFLHWYFTQKIKYNEESLLQMKRRRRSLLEFAMETETYKVVKELLEKYDKDYHKKIFELTPAIEAPPPLALPLKGSFGETEVRKRPTQTKPMTMPVIPASGQSNATAVRSPLQSMPRPVLPRERTLVDRIVDYLVGDGPSNRYALICRQCQSHNGMALKEEFELIAFRCCYCFHWNPPRNQQQSMPARLPLPAPSSPPMTVTELSSSNISHEETSAVEEIAEINESRSSGEPEAARISPSSSPSLRKRATPLPSPEINAVLEEDRTHFSQEQKVSDNSVE